MIYYRSPHPIYFLRLRCVINSTLSAPSAYVYTGHVCTVVKAKEHTSWSPILPCTSGKLAGSPGGEFSYRSSLNSKQFLVQAVWMWAAWDQSSDKRDLTSEQCGCQGDIIPCKRCQHAGAPLLTGVLRTTSSVHIHKSKSWLCICLKLVFHFFSLHKAFSLSLPFRQFWTYKPQNQTQTQRRQRRLCIQSSLIRCITSTLFSDRLRRFG